MNRDSLYWLALLLPFGCASLDDFDVERGIGEQRVQGNVLAGVLENFFAVPIPMDVDVASEAAARDSGTAESAHLRALALFITDASRSSGSDQDDFDFLDSVNVFIESTGTGTDLPRVRIATASDISATQRLVFDVNGSVDLLPYSDEGSRFTSEVEGRVPPDDVSFAGTFTVRVDVF